MSFKTIVFFCVQILIIQNISCQCIGAYNGLPFDGPLGTPYGPLAGPYGALGPYGGPGPLGCAPFAPTSGGSFAVSSVSPLAPSGISVFSENAIEGTLTVGGMLPFLGTVALEAVLPTAGTGAVAYGCGNGAVGITAEDYGFGPAGPYGPYGAAGPYGYGPAYGYGNGCGYY